MTITNFDGGSLTPNDGVTLATYDGWTFGITSGTVDIANPHDLDQSVLLNQSGGRSILLNYSSNAGKTNYFFKSADGSDFKLNSFNIDNGPNGASASLTISGYRDGGLIVAAESVDLTASDSAGNINYTQQNNLAPLYSGSLTFNSVFNNIDEIRITFGSDAQLTIDDIDTSAVVLPPTITSATYNAITGALVVTGTNFLGLSGATNDIVANKFTFTGEGGSTYTLTDTANVEITSATAFTLTLSSTDKAGVNLAVNKNGTSSTGGTTYNLAAAEDWAAGTDAAVVVADTTGNGVTVSNVTVPTITSTTYNASTGALVVTGTNFLKLNGATNDIVANKFTFTGEGGSTYTLTDTANVEITSATAFTLALSSTDEAGVNSIVNKNGTSSTGGTTYNLAVAEDWAVGADAAVVVADLTGNGMTASNVAVPAITSTTYNASTGALVVTGTNLLSLSGATNDIVANKFTFTGEGGATYTLTDTTNVEITSGTAFTLTLSGTDKAAINQIVNKNGTTSTDISTYGLAAAEDWAAGADAAVVVADLTGNGITASNVAIPTITSANYDANTGALVVTGTNFLSLSGATNDIVANKFTFTGEGGAAYTLTDSANIEITSGTAFTVALSATDKAAISLLLNKNGAVSNDVTTYNLAAAEDWTAGADAAVVVADLTANGITVSNVVVPTITSATYDASTNSLVVTGTDMAATGGVLNDIDVTKLTLTGQGGATYTLTSSNIEITSATEFTVALNEADQVNVEGLLNKTGTSSVDATTFNVAAAADWNPALAGNADVTGNGITVSNVQTPTITSATYNANIGVLVVTGADFVKASGATNDITANKLTVTGEGGATYTLTDSSNVEITSGTAFAVTLSSTDQAAINQIFNKNGASSTSTTTYNLAAADDWNTVIGNANIADTTGNGITVSNVAAPTITSTTYNANTGALVVTGANFLSLSGATNDIVANKFTFTGEGGATYTLTDTANVEITSGTAFTITLSSTDKTGINQIVNKNGTSSTGGTPYNLAAAEDWVAGADATVVVADLTGNGMTVSNVAVPTITSSTYNANTGALVVTGTNFLSLSGATNDIVANKFTFTGEDGATYTLTDTANVEITSGTAFTLTLSATDKADVNLLLNKNGTASNDATTYDLAAAEDWATGAVAAVNVVDLTGNGITVTITNPSSGGGGNTPRPSSTTTDGVTVNTTTQSNGTVVTTILPVSNNRQDDPSSLFSNYADIPVTTNANGSTTLLVSLPVGAGLNITGKPQLLNLQDATDELAQRLEQAIDSNSLASQEIIDQAQNFLATLVADERVTVQTITPSMNNNQASDIPIIITGPNNASDNKQILIVDATDLPSGTIIQLDHVAFASIIGATRVIGGSGGNFVVGDDQNQYIVLGADDDILLGGGGNDTVGSLAGNDQTSGDAGDDIVFGGTANDILSGGAGNDQLNGGLGFDSASQEGQLSDYQIETNGNVITLTNNSGEIDTFTDVELIRFATGPSLAIAYSNTEAIAHHLVKSWLGRDLTVAEGEAVQNWTDATPDDILIAFHNLPEAADLQDKTSSELLTGLETNPNLVQLNVNREVITSDNHDDQGYLPLGLALNADGGRGYDVLRMTANREDVHLEFVNDRLELTRLNDGAMLSLKNAEMIAFDSGETVVIAHNPVENILARLVHTFFNRDTTPEEWRLGRESLDAQVSHDTILDWFQQHANLQDLSNTDYIETIYSQTLGRAVTDSELNQQLSRLDNNQIARGWLAVEIAQGTEAATHLVGSVVLHEGWI